MADITSPWVIYPLLALLGGWLGYLVVVVGIELLKPMPPDRSGRDMGPK